MDTKDDADRSKRGAQLVGDLSSHPLADVFPFIDDDDLKALAEDLGSTVSWSQLSCTRAGSWTAAVVITPALLRASIRI